jgi:uncharacterized protein
MNKIYFSKSKVHGFGVFAKSNIKKGEIIEICPVVVLSPAESKLLDRTSLGQYYFDFGKNQYAFCLGYGAVYNHSYKPNAMFKTNLKKTTIIFRSITEIKKGEEIFTNYNGSPNDQTPLEIWWNSSFEYKDKE